MDTGGSWFAHLFANRQDQVQGDQTSFVQGNSDEYVHGSKSSYVFGVVEELYLGTKTEMIFGVETKILLGGLLETMGGAKLEAVVAITIEMEKGKKWHIPAGGKFKLTPDETVVADKEDQLIGAATDRIGQLRQKVATEIDKVAEWVEKSTTLTERVTSLKQKIASYEEQFGTVKWSGTDFTRKVTGTEKLTAAIWHVKASGSATITGSSKIVLDGKGGVVELSGGKVTLNKQVVAG